MTAPAILVDFARRGFTLRAVAGRLSVSPASALTSTDRDTIRRRRNELLSILAPGEPWDQQAAIRLMLDADALVERLGVDGRHPAISDTAAAVASAYRMRDLETLRFAVAEFEATVRGVAAGRAKPGRVVPAETTPEGRER
jgi:hypothetical protein